MRNFEDSERTHVRCYEAMGQALNKGIGPVHRHVVVLVGARASAGFGGWMGKTPKSHDRIGVLKRSKLRARLSTTSGYSGPGVDLQFDLLCLGRLTKCGLFPVAFSERSAGHRCESWCLERFVNGTATLVRARNWLRLLGFC